MAKTPVDECPAGIEMDAAIARALGLNVQKRPWGCTGEYFAYLAGTYADEYDGWAEHEDWRPVLPYSTDIGAAWQLDKPDWRWQFIETPDRLVIMLFTSTEAQIETSKRFPPSFPPEAAIVVHQEWENDKAGVYALLRCRTFLKACGVEHIEVAA